MSAWLPIVLLFAVIFGVPWIGFAYEIRHAQPVDENERPIP